MDTTGKTVTLQKAVASYLGKWPAADYRAEVAEIAQYYGAGIMKEPGKIIITEDAEVVSIETIKKL
jgi:hypothetical protein